MRAKVLGTAAGGGVPQWNCACRNCTAARAGAAPRRLVASLAVSADDARWVIVNAGCDVGHQINDFIGVKPGEQRSSPVVAVLLTDANVDHTAGVLEFRQASEFSVYSTALVKRTLCAAPMFEQFARGTKGWQTFENGARVRVNLVELPSLQVHAITVPGLLPSYAGGEMKEGATVAYVFEHAKRRLVYAPIFLALDDNLKREIDRADAMLLDGTCWSDNEMIELGLGTRTSRAMGHAPMWGPGGSLQTMGELHAGHRYYTHVNNSNPILDPSSTQAQQLLQAGFTVASDGLEINLDGGTAQT